LQLYAIDCRIADIIAPQMRDVVGALAVLQPPETVQVTSYCPPRLVATSGCWISIRSTGRAKNISTAFVLMRIFPEPGLIQTRATAFLRLPVA